MVDGSCCFETEPAKVRWDVNKRQNFNHSFLFPPLCSPAHAQVRLSRVRAPQPEPSLFPAFSYIAFFNCNAFLYCPLYFALPNCTLHCLFVFCIAFLMFVLFVLQLEPCSYILHVYSSQPPLYSRECSNASSYDLNIAFEKPTAHNLIKLREGIDSPSGIHN